MLLVTLKDNPVRDAQAARAAQQRYLRRAASLRAEAARWLQEGWEGFAAICLRFAYLAEDAAIDEARVDRGDVPLIGSDEP